MSSSDAKMNDSPRRSTRVSKPVDRFAFVPDPPKKRRRTASRAPTAKKRKITVKHRTPAEQASEYVTKPFETMFLNTISTMGLSSKRIDTRSKALRQTLRRAIILSKKGHVSATKNGEYLVTSSDGMKTYQVRSTPLASTLHFTCDCGRQYDQGDRVSCKHIFAVVLNVLDSISNMFFQVSSRQTVQDLHELCTLVGKINMDPDLVKPHVANAARPSRHPRKSVRN